MKKIEPNEIKPKTLHDVLVLLGENPNDEPFYEGSYPTSVKIQAFNDVDRMRAKLQEIGGVEMSHFTYNKTWHSYAILPQFGLKGPNGKGNYLQFLLDSGSSSFVQELVIVLHINYEPERQIALNTLFSIAAQVIRFLGSEVNNEIMQAIHNPNSSIIALENGYVEVKTFDNAIRFSITSV